MDERSTKRRRVSSSTSVDDGEQRPLSRRPSFMSPTKSSLARYNPGLLKSPHLAKSPRRPQSRNYSEAPPERESPRELSALPDVDVANSTRQVDALFDDLNLDIRNAPLEVNNVQRSPRPEDDAPQQADPQDDVDVEKARALKARERDAVTKELQELRRSCKQLERLLDRTKDGSGTANLDDASMAQLEGLLIEDDSAEAMYSGQSVSTMLDSFLPFTNPASVESRPLAEEIDVPSHRPLELKNPLPCLQLFTNLQCSLHSDPPRTDRNAKGQVISLQQQHLQLRDAKRLFSASISCDVATCADEDASPAIQSLRVTDYPYWARAELSSWIGQRQEDCDLGCLTYGLGSYYEMTLKRASVWMQCKERFPHLLQAESADNKENDESLASAKVTSQAKISSHVGLRSLLLQDKEALLHISWTVGLDWTGEAESELAASAAFIQPYHDVDNRKSLLKVPVTFDRLVKDRGVFAAIEAMVSILFS